MWKRLIDLIAPFSTISSELRIIRELYELDLASRTPPIIRVTETPGKFDTEVSYVDDEPKKKRKEQDLLDSIAELEEE